jgi:hypothetical protein
MRTIQLNIPDSVDLKDYDFLMIVASKLYEDAKLSSGHYSLYNLPISHTINQ